MSRSSKLNGYEILEEIGKGGFGVVYKARCIDSTKSWNGSVVALKKIDTSRASKARVAFELRALKELTHKNIVKFFEEFTEGNAQYIAMEYCKYGSLRDFVKKYGRLSDFAASFVLRQLVGAVKYVHVKGVMHRDLSAGNVLITAIRGEEKLCVKVADFGLATFLQEGDAAGTIVGTPGYIAPQVFKRNYNLEADVFSLGGILYLMLKGSDPPREEPADKLDLTGLSPDGALLVSQMMASNQELRISLDGIRLSSFFRKADGMDTSDCSLLREQSYEAQRISSRDRLPYSSPAASQPRVRAQSAQPRGASQRGITKDSAFESGDIISAKSDRCQRVLEGRSRERTRECRHSFRDDSRCRWCFAVRPTPTDQLPCTNFARGNVCPQTRSERFERRETAQSSRPQTRILSTRTTMSTLGSSDLAKSSWPLNIIRLAPNRLLRKSGRFIFESNGSVASVVFEATRKAVASTDADQVCAILVVKTRSSTASQSVSLHEPYVRCLLPRLEDALIARKPSSCVFNSLEQMQTSTDRNAKLVLSLYARVIEAVKHVGGKVEKIVFKPSKESTARLMENGDFRLKFSDGRLIVQKKGASSFNATDESGSPITLSSECARVFSDARLDALKLENLLEGTSFKEIRPFPFHFANSSLFSSSKGADESEGRELAGIDGGTSKVSNGVTRDSLNQYHLSNDPFGVSNAIDRIKPLSNTNASARRSVRQQSHNAADQENVDPLSAFRKVAVVPRLLSQGEYELRGSLPNSSGVRTITSISLVGSTPQRRVRASTTTENVFILEENGVEQKRFRFDGEDFSDVPSCAVNLVYTLYRKRTDKIPKR